MNRLKLLLTVGCICVCATLTISCDDDDHICTLPVYSGFSIVPTEWEGGDTVTITAVQKTIGNLLYKAEYSWSVACADTTFSDSYDVVYDYEPYDPYITFTLPDDFSSSYANISFSAQFSYSATAPTTVENSYDSSESGIYGSITSYAASSLYGTASGSYVLTW